MNKLKDFRIAKNLTQQELADKVGTSPQQIMKLEKDVVKLSTRWILKLAKALDIQPTELLPDGFKISSSVGYEQDCEKLQLALEVFEGWLSDFALKTNVENKAKAISFLMQQGELEKKAMQQALIKWWTENPTAFEKSR